MRTSDFDYDLPDELIAHYPLSGRSDSRLLVVNKAGPFEHRQFNALPTLVNDNDLIIVNNTKVIPARLYAKKSSGGQVEILIERIESDQVVLAHVRASRSPKPCAVLDLFSDRDYTNPVPISFTMIAREGALFRLQCTRHIVDALKAAGHMPLPPYIDRDDEASDKLRYQTLFAKNAGAVAAPTAGLHFDGDLIKQLQTKGTRFAEITLHVGAGTFQPIKVEDVHKHQMHSEWISVSAETCQAITDCKARGGRIIAVGTTAVRALESACAETGTIKPFEGLTRIFIYPGYRFKAVDAMITNFHLPKSTLLMLVSAFSGQSRMLAAYQEAIEHRYRFFSYGDAMFLVNRPKTVGPN